MNRLLRAAVRLNLFLAFLVLLGVHMLMYFLLGTEGWVTVALSAALVETAVLSAFQLYATYKTRAK